MYSHATGWQNFYANEASLSGLLAGQEPSLLARSMRQRRYEDFGLMQQRKGFVGREEVAHYNNSPSFRRLLLYRRNRLENL